MDVFVSIFVRNTKHGLCKRQFARLFSCFPLLSLNVVRVNSSLPGYTAMLNYAPARVFVLSRVKLFTLTESFILSTLENIDPRFHLCKQC